MDIDCTHTKQPCDRYSCHNIANKMTDAGEWLCNYHYNMDRNKHLRDSQTILEEFE